MSCRSKAGLRALASVVIPAMLGGCACFTPVLKAADAALTAAIPGAAPPPAEAIPARVDPARVKGFSKSAPEARERPRPVRAEPAPRRQRPRAGNLPAGDRDTATAVDEADAAAVAGEARRLALAEEAAREASEKAVAEAHAMMLKGHVQAARQRLVAAMNGSNSLVVLAFARTFDPGELGKLAKADATPDASRARALYEHARQLGAKDADGALKRLAASEPKSPEAKAPEGTPAAAVPAGALGKAP